LPYEFQTELGKPKEEDQGLLNLDLELVQPQLAMSFCELNPCQPATKTKPHLLQKVGMEQIGEAGLAELDEGLLVLMLARRS
jgi:hypothetical protein